MKYILFLSFSFYTLFAVNAQQQTGVEKRLFSANILTPGLEYEVGLTNTTTLDLRLGTGFAYRKGSFGEGLEIEISLLHKLNIASYRLN